MYMDLFILILLIIVSIISFTLMVALLILMYKLFSSIIDETKNMEKK